MGALKAETEIQFEIHTVCGADQVRSQVAFNSTRDLPQFDAEPFKRLKIIANGPSAKDADLSGPTMALNGALNIFPKDQPPTWWAACDPQELVADFLIDPPEETTYLVASKCHPRVFDRLKNRKVIMWHVSDYSDAPRAIPCAMSITLCALQMAPRLGFRGIDVYGWDASFSGVRHHAYQRPGEVIEHAPIQLEVGDQTFNTTTTWAAEVNDAEMILPVLKYLGCDIQIHGPSMVAAVRRYREAHE